MKYLFLPLSILISTHSFLCAEDGNDLQKILDEATYIATKTKLNADYVPGIVNVISGEKLKSLGITNLAEQNAYDSIVGFDSSTLSLRGAGSIYGSQGNKIKWMINDKPITSEIWGLPKLGVGQIAFPIPVDTVERIEIIRGPGSAVYGGNAIYGVINIITKKGSEAIFSTFSQMESNKFGKSVGAYGSYEENDLAISTVVSVEKSDGWTLPIVSQSPAQSGNLPNASSNNLLMTDASYKNFDFWVYRLETKKDYARLQWDPTNYLPQDNDKPVQSNIYTMLGLEGRYDLFSNTALKIKAGMNQYTNCAEVMYYPASVLGSSLDGMRTIDYSESTKYVEGTLESTFDSHRLMGGAYIGFLSVDQDDVLQTWSYNSSWLPVYHPGVASNLLTVDNPKRINKALYVQDEIQFDHKSTATIGARYDTYSDGRKALSPRIGFVYLYDESNILKVQYSRAFRPPSFSEQFSPNNPVSNKTYESETVDTIEFSYVFKTKDASIKTTAFNAKTSDMITFHDFTYETINLENSTTVNGVELELVKNYDNLQLGANMGWYKSHRGEIKLPNNGYPLNYDASEFALSSKFLGNVFATINSDTFYPTTLWYHYTGSKHRVSNNLIDDNGNTLGIYTKNGSVPAQDYLNITQKIEGISKGLDLEFGIKNVFGKTLKTLYFPLNPPNTNDVPYMKQTFWANVHYKF